MAKKENKKSNKLLATLIVVILLVVLLVVSFIYGNELLEVINLGKDYKNEKLESNSNNNNKINNELTDSEIKQIYNIIGINDDSDACGVQSVLTQVSGSINNLSNKDKYDLIYFYAYNNKLTTNITSKEYDLCEGYGGECVAITKDNYTKVTKYYNIEDKPEVLFDDSDIYKDNYIFEIPECNIEKYNHDTKYEKKDNEVVVTDNVTIGEEKQTITYIFKLNDNKEYYLYSIK